MDSSFIEVIRKDASITPCKDFFNFIDACFLHRRKKLKNSLVDSGYFESHNLLQNGFRIDKMDLTAKMLRGIGKDPDIRAEELELKDFIELFISFKAPET